MLSLRKYLLLLLWLSLPYKLAGQDCCSVTVPVSSFATDMTFPRVVAFSPTGSCIAVMDQGTGTIEMFPQISGCTYDSTPIVITPGNLPLSISFSPTGNCFIVVTIDNIVEIYTQTGNCTYALTSTIMGFVGVSYAVISPTGTCIAAIDALGGQVLLYPFDNTCTVTGAPIIIPSPFPLAVAFSPSGSCLAISDSTNQTVNIYPQIAGCTYSTTPAVTYMNIMGNQLLFSNTGQCFIIGSTQTSTVTTYPLIAGCTYSTVASSTITPPLSDVDSIVISPSDGCLGVVSSTNALARMQLSNKPTTRGPIALDPDISIYPALGPCSYSTVPNTSFSFNNAAAVNFSPVDLCLAVASPNNLSVYAYCPCIPVTVTPSPAVVVIGDTINLTSSVFGATPPLTYSWTGPNGFMANTPNISIPNATLANTGLYTLTVTDVFDCVGVGSSFVTVDPCPTLAVSVTPTALQVLLGSNFILSGFVSGGVPPYSFLWTGPDGIVVHTQNITVLNAGFSQTGTYTFTVTDSFGCQKSAFASVTIQPNGSLLSQAIKTKYCHAIIL